MTTETKLRGGLVLSLLTLLWVTTMWSNSNTTVKTQLKTIDSLRMELFVSQVEIGRHELTREAILKPNKKINKQYEEYYNHETE
jgi:hypothetical protein